MTLSCHENNGRQRVKDLFIETIKGACYNNAESKKHRKLNGSMRTGDMGIYI